MPYTSAMLKPATASLVVRDPVTRLPLAAGGEAKPLDTYWSRRLVDGDVVIVDQSPIKAASKPTLKTV